MKTFNYFQAAALLAAMLSFSGCIDFPDDDFYKKKEEPLPEESDKYTFLKRQRENAPKVAEKENLPENIAVDNLIVDRPEFQSLLKKFDPEKVTVSNDTAPSDPALADKPAPRFYDDLILLNGDEKVKVSLAFNSAPLVDVLPLFADILGFDFIADSELRGVVTVNFNSNMTRRELWEAFDKMLFLAGAGAVRSGYVIRIMPLAKMPQQGDIRAVSRGDGTSEVLFYPLKNLAVNEITNQLKPFLGTNSVVVPLARQNALLISDVSANIPKLKQILDVADQPVKTSRSRAIIYAKYITPTKLIAELATIMPILGFPISLAGTNNADQPGYIQLNGVDRLQLVMASAANAEAIGEVKRWVQILDNSMADDREQVYIYKVMCGRADHLIQALSAIFNVTGSSLVVSTTTSGATQTQVQQITQSRQQTTVNSNNLAAMSNSMLNTTVDRNSNVFELPVKVFSDGYNNRLVIRTTPRVYSIMRAVLERLDVVPAQVLLQVLIMEVTLTDSTKFGVEYSYQTGDGNLGSLSSINYNAATSSSSTDIPTGQGANFAIFNPDNPSEKFGAITALAGNSNVKVVASPQMLVSSNTKATINVGETIPILTQTSGSTINPDTITNTVDNEDTGIILTVTPQVTSNDLINLDISQEYSKAVTNTYSDIDSPVINKRTITTTMTIGNGRTMIIGGIIQEEIQDDLNTIPFIGNIPFLRRLVGQTDYQAKRVELLVLITGYIINEKSPLEDIIRRYNESVRSINKFEARIANEHEKDMERLRKQKLEELAEQSEKAQNDAVTASPSKDSGGELNNGKAVSAASTEKKTGTPDTVKAEKK